MGSTSDTGNKGSNGNGPRRHANKFGSRAERRRAERAARAARAARSARRGPPPPLFEVTSLEARRMLSFSPSLSAAGGTVLVGAPFALDLAFTGSAVPTSWRVLFGDGTPAQTFYPSDFANSNGVMPNPALVTHPYATAGRYSVTATATVGTANYTTALTLDSTFGPSAADPTHYIPASLPGQVITSTTAGPDAAYATVLQADGKIVVAGVDYGNNFGVLRYNPDGTPDTTFGAADPNHPGLRTGLADIGFGTGATDKALAVAIDANGKVLAAGLTNSDCALARLNADGSLDSGFGANGLVTTDIVGNNVNTDVATSLLVQRDGKIVLAGYTTGNTLGPGGSCGALFSASRYTLTGGLDPAFGTGVVNGAGGSGKETIAIPNSDHDYCQAVLLQPNNAFPDGSHDSLILGGYAVTQNNACGPIARNFVLTRLKYSGQVDGTFGSSGFTQTNIGLTTGGCCASPSLDSDYSLLIQADGKIVAAGASQPYSGALNDLALARYSANGFLDGTFGTGGVVTADLGGDDYAYASVLQSDQKIVVAGTTTANIGGTGVGNDFCFARFNPSGTLDNTFGSLGKLTTDIAALYDSAQSLVVLPDGRLIAAGSVGTGTGQNFGLVSLRSDDTAHITTAAPGVLASSFDTTQITVNWTVPTGATQVKVERSTDGVNWGLLGTVAAPASSYPDGGLQTGTVYQYRLTAIDAAGDASPPAVLTAATQAGPPVNLTAAANGDGSITLNWTPSAGDASTFLVYRSTDGASFTQLANPVSGSNTYTDPASALTPGTTYYYVVQAADAHNPGVYSGFSNVASPSMGPSSPTVAVAAQASPSPATGTTATLSVLGAEDGTDGSGLTYTWSSAGTPPAPVTFGANGISAASTTTVTFARAGDYVFNVRIADAAGRSVTTSVAVTVQQALTGIALTPGMATVGEGGQLAFTATGLDQFNQPLASQPTFTWSAFGVGTVDASSGVYTAPAFIGFASVTATSGNVSAGAEVSVTDQVPIVATAAAASPAEVTGTTANLSVLGDESDGESMLLYTWAATTVPTGAPAPTFSANGTNAAKNATVTFAQPGSYVLQVTIRNLAGNQTTSSTSVIVDDALASVAVSPGTSSLTETDQQQFTATTLNQFGQPLASQSLPGWSAASGRGWINGSGLYTAAAPAGPVTVTATVGGVKGSAAVTVTAAPPTVVIPASASPAPVIGVAANLSVLGDDADGESTLTYTWAATSLPSGAPAPTFNANGTNAAKNTAVTFGKAGAYTFTVTLRNAAGVTTTSAVAITVQQTATTIAVTPGTASLHQSGQQQFQALAKDQFGDPLASQPVFGWGVFTGDGTIDASGWYTAGTSGGTATIAASGGNAGGYATVNIAVTAPTVASAAAASSSTVTGNSVSLSVLGDDAAGEGGLIYTWSVTGTAPPVTFSDNGTNSAKSTSATFYQAGSYTFNVTITNAGGASATSTVGVTVNATPTALVAGPSNFDVADRGTRQLTATLLDQFNQPVSGATVGWSVDGGGAGGSVNNAGLYTAPASGSGTDTVRAAAGGYSAAATALVTPSPTAPPQWDVVGEQTVPVTLDVLPANSPSITAVTQPTYGSVTTVTGSPGELVYTFSGSGPGTDAFTFQTSDGVQHPVGIDMLEEGSPGHERGRFPGSKLYVLSNGFWVEPPATFRPVTTGNFHYHEVKQPPGVNGTSFDPYGYFDPNTTYSSETLDVTSTLGSDGSWGYNENATIGTTIVDSPANPDPANLGGVDQTRTTVDAYAFAASGASGSSSYALSASEGYQVNGHAGWPGDGGHASATWNGYGTYAGSFSASSDLVAHTSTGTSLETGSDNRTATTVSPLREVEAGVTLTGQTTQTDSNSDNFNYSPTLASLNPTNQSTSTYSVTGSSAWSDGIGDSSNATVRDSGSAGATAIKHINYNLSNGAWVSTGFGQGNSSASGKTSVEGSGSYAETLPDTVIQGTTSSDCQSSVTNSLAWNDTLDTTGVWDIISGTGGSDLSTGASSTYSGSGSYADPVLGGTMGGTRTESGTQGDSSDNTVSSNWSAGQWADTGEGSSGGTGFNATSYTGSATPTITDGAGTYRGTAAESGGASGSSQSTLSQSLGTDGTWTLGSGAGGSTATGDAFSSYSGSGTYSDDMGDGIMHRTAGDTGNYTASWNQSIQQSLGADGNWTASGGTGTNTSSSADTSSYTGTGGYTDSLATATRTGSITGTSTESGTYSSSTNNAYHQSLGADGNWSITDGTGTGTVADTDFSTYHGSGSYTDDLTGNFSNDAGAETHGGSMSGPASNSGYAGGTSNQSVSAHWDSQGLRWASTGFGSTASSSDASFSYNASGSYTDSVAGPTSSNVSGATSDHGNTDSWSQRSWSQTVGADASWTISSGNGTTTTTNSDSSNYSGTGSRSDTLTDGTVTGTTTDAGSNYAASGSSIGSAWDPQHSSWTDTGTASDTATSGDASTYSGSGTYADSLSDGTVSGTATETGSDTPSFNQSVGESLNANGSWSITVGSSAQTDSGRGTLSYHGSGSYTVHDTADIGSIAGTRTDNRNVVANWGSSVGTSWAGSLWTTAANSSGINTTFSDLSYSGSGPYTASDASKSLTGTHSKAGEDKGWLSVSYGSSLVSGAWASTGQESSSSTGYYRSNYNGGGGMTIAGPYSSSLAGHETETASATSSYSSSFTESLGADGNWTLNPGGTASTMDSLYSSSSYSGSGAYSHAINGGTATGTATDTIWHLSSNSLSTNSTVNASGKWASSGNQSRSSSGAATSSYSGSGPYSRQVETTWQAPVTGGTTVSGTYSESASALSTSSYSSSTSLHPDGTASVTGGGGSSTLSTSLFVTYSGSGAGGQVNNADGTTATTTYTEKGYYRLSSSVAANYSPTPGGAWLATTVVEDTMGNDGGGYSYSCQSSGAPGTPSTSWMAAESHVYGFGNGPGGMKTITPSLGAAPTIDGAINDNAGNSADGAISYAHCDSCGPSYKASSYHFVPSWSMKATNGTLSEGDVDPGTITTTSSSNGAAPTSQTSFTPNGIPAFPGSPWPDDPVAQPRPSFGAPGAGPTWGYLGKVPAPVPPQPVTADNAAVIGADASVRTTAAVGGRA